MWDEVSRMECVVEGVKRERAGDYEYLEVDAIPDPPNERAYRVRVWMPTGTQVTVDDIIEVTVNKKKGGE